MNFQDYHTVLFDLLLVGPMGDLCIRIPHWGSCSVALFVAPPNPLPDAPSPAVVGVLGFPTPPPNRLMIPLGFRSADCLLDGLSAWLNAPAPLVQKPLLNLTPHGFSLIAWCRDSTYRLRLTDGRENPGRDQYDLVCDAQTAARCRAQVAQAKHRVAAEKQDPWRE